ncbi:NodT family efflux transporter outer membrane factor (OMF) lipoprotein [Inhella inkyongensis]|uniref:NodT family efflux transporter outer membrane factor (OMF) lipoprotein n=1 Tax=Inhella inkyongensis TaxID=392593 RepID=A0A840RXT6_9BURK|nr:efflux transporter outer membrane subunit [Inhella inkyongensis]MBB5203517.1 NodT family efflux transporter outer membrane factor (OMF) lipoprotein [Inhella inkyongensis]
MRLLPLILSLGLTACALTPPAPPPRPNLPAMWQSELPQAELPHAGQTASLVDWWRQFNDAQLLELQAQAQARSPLLAQARARLAQARAQAQMTGAAQQPQLMLQAGAQRAQTLPTLQPSTTLSAQGLASWEWDLFGAQRGQTAAAAARAAASQSQWHEARVSLGAEVALAYLSYRHAQLAADIASQDLQAAERIERAALAAAKAGSLSAAQAAELTVARADAQVGAAAQHSARGQWLQTLALLVADDDAAALGERLGPARLVQAPPLPVPGVPAQALAQRPDLSSAHQLWVASVMELHSAEAQRYPQLSWGALLGEARLRMEGNTLQGQVWSLAPTLSLPLFDGGLRRAQVDGAQAREQEARAALEQAWRSALAEVEDALLGVQRAQKQAEAVMTGIAQWQRLDAVASQRERAGLISASERAQSARQFLAAQRGAYELALARSQAWISLYRRLGGGWTPDNAS